VDFGSEGWGWSCGSWRGLGRRSLSSLPESSRARSRKLVAQTGVTAHQLIGLVCFRALVHAHRQAVVSVVAGWWSKYRVTLRDIEGERDAAKARMDGSYAVLRFTSLTTFRPRTAEAATTPPYRAPTIPWAAASCPVMYRPRTGVRGASHFSRKRSGVKLTP